MSNALGTGRVPRHLGGAGGVRNGEEVLVEQGEAFSFHDILPKILGPFIAKFVLFTQVRTSGGAVAGDCKTPLLCWPAIWIRKRLSLHVLLLTR